MRMREVMVMMLGFGVLFPEMLATAPVGRPLTEALIVSPPGLMNFMTN